MVKPALLNAFTKIELLHRFIGRYRKHAYSSEISAKHADRSLKTYLEPVIRYANATFNKNCIIIFDIPYAIKTLSIGSAYR